MNAQHKRDKIHNRFKRIFRRIDELDSAKMLEVKIAEKNNREPVLGVILAHKNRLELRLTEVKHILAEYGAEFLQSHS